MRLGKACRFGLAALVVGGCDGAPCGMLLQVWWFILCTVRHRVTRVLTLNLVIFAVIRPPVSGTEFPGCGCEGFGGVVDSWAFCNAAVGSFKPLFLDCERQAPAVLPTITLRAVLCFAVLACQTRRALAGPTVQAYQQCSHTHWMHVQHMGSFHHMVYDPGVSAGPQDLSKPTVYVLHCNDWLDQIPI